MKLKDYLKKEGMSARELGRLLGLHFQTMYAYTSGRLTPGKKVAKTIIELSNGEVTEQDLMRTRSNKPTCPTCGRIVHRKPKRKKILAENVL